MDLRDKQEVYFIAEEESEGKPWWCDIKCFLKKQEYPAGVSNVDRKTLWILASKFFINGYVLYKINYDMVFLRYVDRHEADTIVKAIHEGSEGIHVNGHVMAKKFLRASYYLTTMEFDCFNYVKRWHKFQIYVDKVCVPPTPLNVLTSPCVFSMRGFDMIWMIEPKASNDHRFILVAINYFTKWVEVASYINVIGQVVIQFIKKEIICRYKVPSKIITVMPVTWIIKWWKSYVRASKLNTTKLHHIYPILMAS